MSTGVEVIQIDNLAGKTNRKSQKHIKDQGWGWVIVFASFLSQMLNYGIIYSYGVLAPEYIRHYQISRVTVGWMGSTLPAITGITASLASYLCRKFSYRTVSLIGSVISVIGFGAPYFYNELWFLIVSSSIVCGIGFGLAYLPSIIIVNEWFDKKRSLAIGLAVCGVGLGTFAFTSILEILLASFNWQLTMLIIAGILLLLIPCSLTYVNFEDDKSKDVIDSSLDSKNENIVEMKLLSKPNDCKTKENNIEDNLIKKSDVNIEENDNKSKESESMNENCDNNSNENNSFNLYFQIMKDPIFILFLISIVFSNIGFNAPYMFAKDRAIQSGINSNKGSFLISAIGIGNCVGRIGFGYLATLKWINRFHLYNVTLTLSGLILILSCVLNHYILMVLYTMIYGMMCGAVVTLTSVILVDMLGIGKLNEAFGIFLVFQGIAVLVGPPFAGFIYDSTQSYNIAFFVCGVFITISGMIVFITFIYRNFREKKLQN